MNWPGKGEVRESKFVACVDCIHCNADLKLLEGRAGNYCFLNAVEAPDPVTGEMFWEGAISCATMRSAIAERVDSRWGKGRGPCGPKGKQFEPRFGFFQRVVLQVLRGLK